MRKFVIRYGILGGSLSIVLGILNWTIVTKLFTYQTSQVVGYLSVLIAMSCIPLGIKYFRDKLNMGKVSLKEGLRIGFGITVILSIIVFFYNSLFFVFAGDEFQQWQQASMTQSQIKQNQEMINELPKFILSPWFQGFIAFLFTMIIGFIINFLSSILLKSSREKARIVIK